MSRRSDPQSMGSSHRGSGGGDDTRNAGVYRSEMEVRQSKRHTKQKSFDIRPLIITMLEDTITRREFPWDRRPVQPHSAYARYVLPPMANRGDPSDCFCTKIARSAVNKIRCPINQVIWTPEGRRFITGAASGEFTLWDGFTYAFDTIFQAHDSPILSLEWSHNNDWLISADQGGLVKYWSANMNPNEAIEAHKDAVRDLSFSPTDSKFCSCSDDGSVKVWDFWHVKQDIELTGHGWDVKCVDWHPTSSLIASGSKDSRIKFWDPRAGKDLKTISSHKRPISKVQWNPNGFWLLTASQDHTMKLFDIRKMQEFQTINCDELKPATCKCFFDAHFA
eukprot:gb/GECG01006936.1/.p1 GENE.gb/GECG01006936.1/~~gb/GECG01006936.1/.p1  ORF type:complete len:335 (+),score=24.45 gb/GECG01006936.1/:1-1005(+)